MSEGAFAKFYKSTKWQKISRLYMQSRFYICERCGAPATICHHRTHLNAKNLTEPDIALGFENLEALCMSCHIAEHCGLEPENREYIFDNSGNILNCIENSLQPPEKKHQKEGFSEARLGLGRS